MSYTGTARIGALVIKVTANDKQVDEVIAEDVLVEVEYNYRAGYAPIIRMDPNDCDPGCPDEVEILSITASGDIELEGEFTKMAINDGTELSPWLTYDQIRDVEEQMDAPKPDYEPNYERDVEYA